MVPSQVKGFGTACGMDGLCDVTPELPSYPSRSSKGLTFTMPLAADGFPTDDAVAFAWSSMDQAAFVEVFDHPIASEAEFRSSMLWVASWQPGNPPPGWGEGYRVDGTQWNKPPNPLPKGKPLYAAVLVVDGASLVAATPLTPFYVGQSPWPYPGATCTANDDCLNPGHAMVCMESMCQLVCMSDFGCPTGHLCGLPTNGIRLCAR
jgi:hypothetical protein